MADKATAAVIKGLIDQNAIDLKAVIDTNATNLKAKVDALVFNPDPAPVVAAPKISYAVPLAFTVGKPIGTLPVTNSGGAAVFSGALPDGLAVDKNTGDITGTPKSAIGLTNFTITAINVTGNSSTIIPMSVNPAPVVTPPGNTIIVGGKVSGAVTLKSNTDYIGLTIDMKGANNIPMTGNGVSNINIRNCKIINAKNFGILLNGCTNVTIDGNLISNIGFGIYAQSGSKIIKVTNNQILNVNGIDEKSLGHAIQFNGVNGGGNQINNNRIENIRGVALNPHDQINVYKSDGLVGDQIQIFNNWVRGGQIDLWPTANSGAAGIVVGDVGGSYQICRGNIVVNPGIVGIQAQGGNHILVDANTIYGDKMPNSVDGLDWGNWSGLPSSDIVYSNNKVRWYNKQGSEVSHFEHNQNGSVTLINNTWNADIDASVLPDKIITMQ